MPSLTITLARAVALGLALAALLAVARAGARPRRRRPGGLHRRGRATTRRSPPTRTSSGARCGDGPTGSSRPRPDAPTSTSTSDAVHGRHGEPPARADAREAVRRARCSASRCSSTCSARRTTSPTSTRGARTARSGRASATARSPRPPASRRCARGRRSAGSPPRRTAPSRRPARRSPATSTSSAARTDCWNAQRLRDMDLFLLPVRNPDGRDAIQRTQRLDVRPQPRLRHAEPDRERRVPAAVQAVPGRLLHRRPPDGQRLLLPAQRGSRPPRDLRLHPRLHRRPDRPGDPPDVQRPEHRLLQLRHVRPVRARVRRHRAVAALGRRRHDVREGHAARSTASRSTSTTWRSTRRSTSPPATRRRSCTGWVEQWAEAVRQGAGLRPRAERAREPADARRSSSSPPTTCAATSSGPTATRATRPR